MGATTTDFPAELVFFQEKIGPSLLLIFQCHGIFSAKACVQRKKNRIKTRLDLAHPRYSACCEARTWGSASSCREAVSRRSGGVDDGAEGTRQGHCSRTEGGFIVDWR